MASAKGKGQPSIKHSCNFSESKRKLSRISDHEHDLEYPYTSQRHTRSSKLSQMLSRDALISAVDLMWDRSDSNLTSSLKDRDEEVTKFELSAEQKGNNNMSQLVRVSEKMCYTQNYMQSLFIGAKHNGFPLEDVAPTVTRFHEGDAEIEKKESCTSGNVNEGHSNLIESRSPLLGSITEPSRSMDANSLFLLYKDRCANSRGVNPSKMSSCSGNNPHKDSLSVFGNKELLERDRKDQEDEVCSSSKETPTYAFAGALAGVSVSLCLHPLDTVKTMIQSCRLQDKSLCYTGRSIISERGKKHLLEMSYQCALLLKSQYVFQVFLDYIVGLLATLPHQLLFLRFIHSLMNQLKELCSLFFLRFLISSAGPLSRMVQVNISNSL